MNSFAVIGAPALAAWAISVQRRCINATAQRVLYAVILAMIVWLIAAFAVGGQLVWYALASDAVLVAVIEACLAANIIPSIRNMREVFHRLPFDLRILAPGGREVYKTDIARKVDGTTLYRLYSAAPRNRSEPALAIRMETLPEDILKVYRLQAGVAVLAEQAGELDSLQKRLESQRDLLMEQNDALRRQHAMRSILYRQERERELGERVEHDLAETVSQIRTILDNRLAGDDPLSIEERRAQLNLVKVLVAYCKRKGMLALAGAESDTMDNAELDTIAHEAMADLRSIGIECAFLVATERPIPMSAVNTVYDSFYDCILSVLPRANPVLMVYISQTGNALVMRASIECAIGLDQETALELIPRIATSTEPWTAVQMDIAHNLEGRLAKRGEDYSVSLDDGLVSVTVKADAATLRDPAGGQP